MYKRFKWNPEIRFETTVFNELPKLRAGSRIFWGSTIELFGDWVDPEWMRLIMERVKAHTELTHIFLTKQPQNLLQWSPFPENVWVGVTATNQKAHNEAVVILSYIKASIKFISHEPLLERISLHSPYSPEDAYDWDIIGAQTKPYKPPVKIWVDEITEACKRTGIPYFLKDNLIPLMGDNLVQEMPK